MLRGFIKLALAVVAAVFVIQAIPDLKRYIRIARM